MLFFTIHGYASAMLFYVSLATRMQDRTVSFWRFPYAGQKFEKRGRLLFLPILTYRKYAVISRLIQPHLYKHFFQQLTMHIAADAY